MAFQSVGGVSAASSVAPTGMTAPADGARRGASQSDDSTAGSTIVISTVTKTNSDGSTVTTVTYADGHTKVETTPPKYAATAGKETQANAPEAGGRVTAVDILV